MRLSTLRMSRYSTDIIGSEPQDVITIYWIKMGRHLNIAVLMRTVLGWNLLAERRYPPTLDPVSDAADLTTPVQNASLDMGTPLSTRYIGRVPSPLSQSL